MLTIDKLIEILMTEETDYAGMRAVVRALRDHIAPLSLIGMTFEPHELREVFNEILGDAGEKVAGGSTREDEKAVEAVGDKGPVTVNSPATAPAPAVCAWTKRKYEPGFYATPHGIKFKDRRYDNCGICGREIKFTEAKT